MKSHCQRNHELTGANVYTNPKTGRRFCRACQRDEPKRQEPYRDPRTGNPNYRWDRATKRLVRR